MSEPYGPKPDLADRLRSVGQALEQSSLAPASNMIQQTQLNLKKFSSCLQHFGEEWEKLVQEAHQVHGFKDFLQPVSFVHPCGASISSAITVLNVSHLCCDAVMLSSSLVRLILLPGIGLGNAEELAWKMV
jgi:hypothetical protein